MSEEKKIEEKNIKKANKIKLAFEKFKEASNKLIHHPFVEKYINYISFSIILLILIFVRLQNQKGLNMSCQNFYFLTAHICP